MLALRREKSVLLEEVNAALLSPHSVLNQWLHFVTLFSFAHEVVHRINGKTAPALFEGRHRALGTGFALLGECSSYPEPCFPSL